MDHVAQLGLGLRLDVEVQGQGPAGQGLGGVDQVLGEVGLNPFPEETVRDVDLQGVAIDTQFDALSEPDRKARLAQSLGHRRSQVGLRHKLPHRHQPPHMLQKPRSRRRKDSRSGVTETGAHELRVAVMLDWPGR